MDGGVEEPLAAALVAPVVAGILGDVGHQARIENILPIDDGIKTAIKIEIGSVEI